MRFHYQHPHFTYGRLRHRAVNDLFQVTAGTRTRSWLRRQGPWPCSHSESPGTFVSPAPAASGIRIRLLLPPTSRSSTRGLRPQSWPERAGRRPHASAPGHGNQGPAAPRRPKVLEEGSRWRDGTHSKGPFRGPLQGGESEGTTRDPRRSQHARPDSTTLPGPSGPRRGLWDCESFGAIGPRRRPASGLQLPRSRARPCGFWELWSRALRERARRGARELRVPGRSAAGAGAGGLNGGSPAPRQGCVGCGGCGRRRRPGPACGPGG